MKVTINCDMGEGFGLYRMGDDEGLMPMTDLANVACGFHASDPVVMRKTVRLAKLKNVQVGAHPSLPDLQGFGRREMKIEPDELRAVLIYQVGALSGFLHTEGMKLSHIKPHGSLYGMAARMPEVIEAVCDVAGQFGVPVLGMSGTLHEEVCKARGVPMVPEFFADLDYDKNGKLLITREHAAVDARAAAQRVLRVLREGKVASAEGPDVALHAESICVHSDTPGAVAVAQAVRKAVDDFNRAAGARG